MKKNYIQSGNSLKLLQKLSDETIDIIITSPPYNAGHNYDIYNDNLEKQEYIAFLTKIFKQCYRVLKKDGRICINIPFAIKNMKSKQVYFVSSWVTSICEKIGFKSFEYIAWHKGKALNHFQGNNTAWGSWKSPSCPNFRPLGEVILVFYKEEKSHKGEIQNIDISSEEFKNWTKNMWYFDETNSTVMCVANNARKNEHPAPFPSELVARLLKLYSYKGDLVLDPFNGIGTTTHTAYQMERHYIGFDISSNYCDIARNKINNE